MRGLRLLLISPALPPDPAGNARQAARLAAGLRKRGWTVRLARPREALAVAARFRPDRIWGLHLTKSGPAARACAAAAGVPYGLTVTGTDANLVLARGSLPATERRALTAAAVLAAPDPGFSKLLRRTARRLTLSLPPIVVLEPAIELPAGVLRRPPRGRPYILWSGGLRAVKDAAWALAAFEPFHRRHPDFRLVVTGPALESGSVAAVSAAAADSERGVEWRGPLGWRANLRLMAGAAVVFNSSRAEALPHALGEALALGVPVVARDIPGNRFALAPRGPGLRARTPAGAARALERARALRPRPRRVAPEREAAAFDKLLRKITGSA